MRGSTQGELFLLYFLSLFFIVSCGDGGKSTGNIDGGLLKDINAFEYQGSFRISSETFGESNVNYAIGTLAYNSDKHSLFIAGHAQHNAIGEFPIPELTVQNDVNDFNVANSALQDFRNILSAGSTGNPEGIDRVTGLYYKNGQLIVNAETWYDAPGDNSDTTLVVRDANNLATSSVEGYFELEGAARAGGYISEVPPEWQDRIGSTHITGWSSVYSIISRYSLGPSMYSFDINQLLDTSLSFNENVPTTALMSFPYSGGEYLDEGAELMNTGSSASDLWNSLSNGVYGFIIPGTNTFAVIGSSSGIVGGIGYKITQDNGNLCGGPCPYISSEVYNYYWFFDVEEILAASRVSEPRPYAYGKWSLPFDDNGSHSIIGASYDSENNMLYIALQNAGRVATYDRPPLIHGYSISID